MSLINEEEINRLARLARLKLTSAEMADFTKQLSEIVNFVDQLSMLKLKDINLLKPRELAQLRQDKIGGESLTIKDIAKLAPVFTDNQVEVPPVFGESPDV